MTRAIVLAPNAFEGSGGKTAHGLVRHSERFEIAAVVDNACPWHDAGILLDGQFRGIPTVPTIADGIAQGGITTAIVGIATPGGAMTPELRELLFECAHAGLNLVSGLHDFLADDDEISSVVESKGTSIIDVRRPPTTDDLDMWSGEIANVRAQRIAVLGTDCAIGKRTTSTMLLAELSEVGIKATLVTTGQTGWLQGNCHGIVYDSIPNDFVTGELEKAIVDCDTECQPDVMIIEGQAGLRNPSGAGASTQLVSSGASHVVLQHAPNRTNYLGLEDTEFEIGDIRTDVKLVELLGAEIIAISINTEGMSTTQTAFYCHQLQAELGIPVVAPLEHGVGRIVDQVAASIGSEAA